MVGWEEVTATERLMDQEAQSLGLRPSFTVTEVGDLASVTQPCWSLHFLSVIERNDCPMDLTTMLLKLQGAWSLSK